MTDEFLLADNTDSDPNNWTAVSTLINDSADITVDRSLDWEYQPYLRFIDLQNGGRLGAGSPFVRWTFRALRELQREALRDFCTSLSAEVYIRTPTNEFVTGARVWKDFLCQMLWMTDEERIGVNAVEDIVIEFRNCLDVT
jgi:hypothetical protein